MSVTESDPQSKPAEAGDDFLAAQADMAKAALGKVLRDAQVALGEGVDPKEWARRYPLVAVGAALAAGFAGVYLAVPSKDEQELRKLERIRKALAPETSTDGHTPAAVDGNHKPAPPSMWATILKEVITVARPIITSLITAGVAARSADAAASNPHDPNHP